MAGTPFGNTLVPNIEPAILQLRAPATRLSPGSASSTAAPSQDSKVRLAQYSQQGQFVNGKNFYQNSNQWVDAAAQTFQNVKKQRIQFNSAEYFDFASRNSAALPWLALGQNVQFVLGDTLYEIYDTNN